MDFDFASKNVLISGGSRGIGREVAKMFAAAGARVAINFVQNEAAARETLDSLAGANHAMVQADLAQTADLQRMVHTVEEQMGGIDILINNAAVYAAHPIATISFEEWQKHWEKIIQTNLIGAAHLTFLAAQQMMKRGGGRIVNVSSRGAFRGEPEAPAYGASKAGLNAMGQSLALALAPHNIFVHTVAPGFVETDMAAHLLNTAAGDAIRKQSPLGRVARAEEVARTVLFLAAEGTEFLTGAIVDINGASYLRT